MQVGARCLETGAYGAYYNVLINLDNLNDETEKEKLKQEATKLLNISNKGCETILDIIEQRQKWAMSLQILQKHDIVIL